MVRNSSGAVPECLRSLAWRYLIADSRAKMSTSSLLAGVAGESFVAAELLRRGVIASITLRITRGIDIVVTNKDATKPVIIQCKTSRTTKRRELNFILRDILSRLPRMSNRDDLAPLLPCNWTPATGPTPIA